MGTAEAEAAEAAEATEKSQSFRHLGSNRRCAVNGNQRRTEAEVVAAGAATAEFIAAVSVYVAAAATATVEFIAAVPCMLLQPPLLLLHCVFFYFCFSLSYFLFLCNNATCLCFFFSPLSFHLFLSLLGSSAKDSMSYNFRF